MPSATEKRAAQIAKLRGHGCTYEQIAEILGISVNTAWRHCNKKKGADANEISEGPKGQEKCPGQTIQAGLKPDLTLPDAVGDGEQGEK